MPKTIAAPRAAIFFWRYDFLAEFQARIAEGIFGDMVGAFFGVVQMVFIPLRHAAFDF